MQVYICLKCFCRFFLLHFYYNWLALVLDGTWNVYFTQYIMFVHMFSKIRHRKHAARWCDGMGLNVSDAYNLYDVHSTTIKRFIIRLLKYDSLFDFIACVIWICVCVCILFMCHIVDDRLVFNGLVTPTFSFRFIPWVSYQCDYRTHVVWLFMFYALLVIFV